MLLQAWEFFLALWYENTHAQASVGSRSWRWDGQCWIFIQAWYDMYRFNYSQARSRLKPFDCPLNRSRLENNDHTVIGVVGEEIVWTKKNLIYARYHDNEMSISKLPWHVLSEMRLRLRKCNAVMDFTEKNSCCKVPVAAETSPQGCVRREGRAMD